MDFPAGGLMAKIAYSYDNYNTPGTSGGGGKSNNGRVKAAITICLLVGLIVGAYYAYRVLKSRNAAQTQNKTANAPAPVYLEKPAPIAKPAPVTPVKAPSKVKPVLPVAAIDPIPEIKPVTPPAPLVSAVEKPVVKSDVKLAVAAPVKPAVPVNLPPLDENAVTEICAQAEAAMKAGEPVKARQLAESVLDMKNLPEGSPLWLRTAEVLSAANTRLLLTDIPFPGRKINYVCKNTDFLQNIASAHNTTIDLIQISNRMKSTDSSIWEGRVFRIYKGDWRIRISRKTLMLYLYDGDKLFKIYHVGIGRENRTPEGIFVVRSKVKEPTWYAPSGKIVPYNGAQNVIGSRWLSLAPEGGTDKGLLGYGIHGTADPDSIGKTVSNGCVRMRNAEVEELFMIIPRLTPVTIE